MRNHGLATELGLLGVGGLFPRSVGQASNRTDDTAGSESVGAADGGDLVRPAQLPALTCRIPPPLRREAKRLLTRTDSSPVRSSGCSWPSVMQGGAKPRST